MAAALDSLFSSPTRKTLGVFAAAVGTYVVYQRWRTSRPFLLGKGRVVLITGASSGIGAATARLLARDGATVVLLARRGAELTTVAAEIEAAGGTAAAYPVDCSDADAVAATAAQVCAAHGVPDVIVNSAGLGPWKSVLETTPADVTHCMTAPYFSAAFVALAFLRSMVRRRSPAVVVTVNSPVAYLPWPGCVAYAAARGALRLFQDSLRLDLHGTGVVPVEVVLGRVESPYFAANAVDPAAQLPRAAALIPLITEARAAEAIRDAIVTHRSVTCPWQLTAVLGLHRLLPGLTNWLMRATFPSPSTS